MIESHIWFEPSHDGRSCIAGAEYGRTASCQRELVVIGNPKFFGDGELKVGRHHADYARGLAINANTLADNVRIAAEITFPDFVTKNSDLFRAGFIVLGGEVAPHDWTHTKDLKEILSHIAAGVALRIVFVVDVDCRSIQVRRHHGERMLRVLQVFVILG